MTWIPAGERLPEIRTRPEWNGYGVSERVLVFSPPSAFFIGEYIVNDPHYSRMSHWRLRGDQGGQGADTVTHWQPLPEPPTKE